MVYWWFRAGILPLLATQLPTGTILLHPERSRGSEGAALYARVSCGNQKENLRRQPQDSGNFLRGSLVYIEREGLGRAPLEGEAGFGRTCDDRAAGVPL